MNQGECMQKIGTHTKKTRYRIKEVFGEMRSIREDQLAGGGRLTTELAVNSDEYRRNKTNSEKTKQKKITDG